MSAHLGPAVTAFIDGELDHSRREEVLAHLAHCTSCRAEIDGLRRFKAALRGAAEAPAVPFDLTARLLAATEPMFSLPVAQPSHPRRRPSLPHSRLRRTAVSGAFVAFGLGGALGLAGPPPRGPVAPVDPTSQRFVLDHATTSSEVPFTELDLVSVSSRTASTLP
jgi:anti-sigma factor RsiW